MTIKTTKAIVIDRAKLSEYAKTGCKKLDFMLFATIEDDVYHTYDLQSYVDDVTASSMSMGITDLTEYIPYSIDLCTCNKDNALVIKKLMLHWIKNEKVYDKAIDYVNDYNIIHLKKNEDGNIVVQLSRITDFTVEEQQHVLNAFSMLLKLIEDNNTLNAQDTQCLHYFELLHRNKPIEEGPFVEKSKGNIQSIEFDEDEPVNQFTNLVEDMLQDEADAMKDAADETSQKASFIESRYAANNYLQLVETAVECIKKLSALEGHDNDKKDACFEAISSYLKLYRIDD
jgi:hypothetical protein